MKYCNGCGNVVDNNWQILCPKCGNKLEDMVEKELENNSGKKLSRLKEAEQQYKMGWFKFLIYFALFAGALLNFSQGLQLISGASWYYKAENGEMFYADYFYKMFPGLEMYSLIFGILLIAIAIFMIVTRFMLARFKRGADMCIICLYLVSLISNIVSFVALGNIIKGAAGDSGMITSIAMSAVMLIVNAKYFSERTSLFYY